MEEKILEQFCKKMKLEKADLSITLDTDDWGNYLNECVIYEKTNNGRVWNVTTYSTGRIRQVIEMGE